MPSQADSLAQELSRITPRALPFVSDPASGFSPRAHPPRRLLRTPAGSPGSFSDSPQSAAGDSPVPSSLLGVQAPKAPCCCAAALSASPRAAVPAAGSRGPRRCRAPLHPALPRGLAGGGPGPPPAGPALLRHCWGSRMHEDVGKLLERLELRAWHA